VYDIRNSKNSSKNQFSLLSLRQPGSELTCNIKIIRVMRSQSYGSDVNSSIVWVPLGISLPPSKLKYVQWRGSANGHVSCYIRSIITTQKSYLLARDDLGM